MLLRINREKQIKMDNPWIVSSRLYNTLMSVTMNVPRNHQQVDFRKPTYVRPTVLLFPNKAIADHFQENHSISLKSSCVILKNRHAQSHIHENLTTPVDMVLVKMPDAAIPTEVHDLLFTCPMSQLDDEKLLCMTLISYALFYYIENYYINESDNLVLSGIVINPSLKLMYETDPKEMILRYLQKMFINS